MSNYIRLTKWSNLGNLNVIDIHGREIPLYYATHVDADNLTRRLAELEDMIEIGRLSYKKYDDSRIIDLFVKYDEMKFRPTTVCSDPCIISKEWKLKMVKEVHKLLSLINGFSCQKC